MNLILSEELEEFRRTVRARREGKFLGVAELQPVVVARHVLGQGESS